MFAEVVLVLAGVEEVLRQFQFARPQAKPAFARHRRPEAGASADAAVAAVGALREVEVRLEPDKAAVATAMVGLQHVVALLRGRTVPGDQAV